MQITETSSSGLKRELKIVVGQGELTQRFATRLDEVKDQVQLKGFRKGKVPVAHLKKLYGRSVMAEVVQQTVEETTRKVFEERGWAQVLPDPDEPLVHVYAEGRTPEDGAQLEDEFVGLVEEIVARGDDPGD